MPRPALVYGWTVVALGTVIAVTAALLWKTTDSTAFLACTALAALTSTFKLRLPGLTGTISPAFIFVLVSAGEFGWSETVAISTISALVQAVWKAATRPGLLKVAFNAATLAIAGGLTHGVAHGLVETEPGAEHALFLAVAGLVLLVTNTLLVSTILCLSKAEPLRMVWRSLQTWAVPYYLVGGVLASIWAKPLLTAGPGVFVMAALSVYLLSISYRGLMELARPTAAC